MSYPSAPTPASNTDALSLIAIGSPPPGEVTDFSNPPLDSRPMIILGGLLLALATLFITNRAYFKFRILRRRSWDDLTLALGYVGGIFFYRTCLWGTKDGAWGRHMWDVSISQAASTDFLVPAFLYVVLYPPTLTLIRISFFIMYLDIFGVLQGLKIGAWVGGIVTTLFGVVMTILSFVCATPYPHESWFAQKFTERAELIVRFSLPQSGVGLAIDIYVLILPMMGVTRLQMPFRRKLGVMLIFLSAIFAVLGSLLTIIYRSHLDDDSEYTWNLMPVLTVTLLELFVGIIVACMPAASHTVRTMVPHLESLRSRILQARYWNYLGSFRSSRQSSRSKKPGHSDSDVSEKLRFAKKLSKGHVNNADACESFAGIDVEIPSATLVRSYLRSTDRLDAMDLESGGGFYLSKEWRRSRLRRSQRP